MNKYRNKKAFCLLSHHHDSKKEADYCNSLQAKKKNGEILDFKTQPKFTLLEGFTNSEGQKIRSITYTPDFLVHHDGFNEIVDVKGNKATQTQTWKLKWKLIQSLYREKNRYKFTVA